MEALCLAGIPVVSYQGNNGGFGLVENYRWDRQLLTMNDMVSMLTALKGVNETLEDDELDTAIEKVTALVPPDRAAELEEGFEQFVVDMEPWGGAPRLRSLEPLRERFRRKEASYRDYLDASAGWGGTAGRGKADASAVRLRLRFTPAVRVDRHRSVPAVERVPGERAVGSDARVVDEHVESAPCRCDLGSERARGVVAREVSMRTW